MQHDAELVMAVRNRPTAGIKKLARDLNKSCKDVRGARKFLQAVGMLIQDIVQMAPTVIARAHETAEDCEVYLKSAQAWSFPLGFPIKLELVIPRSLLPYSADILRTKYSMSDDEARKTIEAVEKEMLEGSPRQQQVAVIGTASLAFESAAQMKLTYLEEMDGLVEVLDAANSTLMTPALAAIELGAHLLRRNFLRISHLSRLIIGVGMRVCSFDPTEVPIWPVCVSVNEGQISVVKNVLDTIDNGRVGHVFLVLYCEDRSEYLVDFAPAVIGGQRLTKVARGQGPPGSQLEPSAFPAKVFGRKALKKLAVLVDMLARSSIRMGRSDQGYLAALTLRMRRIEALVEGIPVTPTDPGSNKEE